MISFEKLTTWLSYTCVLYKILISPLYKICPPKKQKKEEERSYHLPNTEVIQYGTWFLKTPGGAHIQGKDKYAQHGFAKFHLVRLQR